MTTLRRGDIVIVELNPTCESEQRVTRPSHVVQKAGIENAPTTIVLRAESGADLPAHVTVDRMAGPDEFLARDRAFFWPDLSRMDSPVVGLADPYSDYRKPSRPTASYPEGGDRGRQPRGDP